jgi:short-subunit dehydrogenase
MIHLQGKVVVITGSANGLGKALAKEFYKRGCHLALIDIDIFGLQSLIAEFKSEKQTISIHHTDISKEEEIIKMRSSIIATHNKIDILINNAGISISQPFEQVKISDFKTLFDTNFWGTVYCTKHFLPDLTKQTGSRLVNIISDFALMGFPGKTTYGSSKSAIMGFTNSLRTEHTDNKMKICMVIPPPLATNIVRNGKHFDNKKMDNEIKFLEKNGMQIDKAAFKIVKQIIRGKYRIIIGPMMFWVDLFSRMFPTLLHVAIGRNKKRFDFI